MKKDFQFNRGNFFARLLLFNWRDK